MQGPKPGEVRPIPVTRVILRRLENGRNGLQTWIREQGSESLLSNRAGTDVRVTIAVRPSLAAGIVAVHEMDVLEADDLFDLRKCCIDIRSGSKRISRGVQVTSIEANPQALSTQPVEEPG